MLKVKNVVTLVCSTILMLFAVTSVTAEINADIIGSPSSFTKVSTFNLFGTDVDDYLDVNSWSNVEPKKIFGYFGYNIGTNTNLNFGVAKQLKKVYLGTFFTGELSSFSTNASSNDADGADKSSSTLKSDDINAFTVGALLGFANNIGAKFSVYYKPTSINNSDKTDSNDKKYSSYADNFVIYPEFVIGTVFNKEKFTLTPHATLSLDSKVNITTTNNDGTKSVTDSSVYILNLNAGTGIGFPVKDGVKTDIDLDASTAWSLYALETANNDGKKTVVFGHVDNGLKLEGKYTIGFNPLKNLSVKLRCELPLDFAFHSDPEYTDVDGTKSYAALRKNSTIINVQPDFKVALQYALLKNKVFFNAGFDFNVPTLNWTIDRNETKDESTVKSTAWSNSFQFKTADMNYALNCGFTALLGSKVTFDANYNILGNIFGGSNTVKTSNLFASGESIWNAPGKIFGATFQFLLTLKL